MADFHRLVLPTYFGGLPGAYDYINNGGSGTPALADGARSDSGPNNGTYFIGFGENGRSLAANRGLKALAENCDLLDDYVHRDVALPRVTADVTAGAPVTSIVLTGPIFIGMAGTPNTVAGIRKFITLVDSEDNEIFNVTECQVASISPDTVGSEWSAGNVTLTITPAIPTSVTYRVYYSTRSNVASFNDDLLLSNRRGYNRYNVGPAWADATGNPASFITRQLDKIIEDLGTGAGTAKIAGTSITGTTYSVPAGTLAAQLIDLNDNIDAERVAATVADAALYEIVRLRADKSTVDGITFTVPTAVTRVRVEMRAPGGGGGGGARGNSADADSSATTGGAGGGAGELRDILLEVVPGEVLTWVKGAAGIAGLGSATVDGAQGGDGTNATLTGSVSGLLVTSRGGLGGGGGVRNIDAGQVGGAIGGRSTNRPLGTFSAPITIDDTTATIAEAAGLIAQACLWLGTGAGSSMTWYGNLNRFAFPGETGVFSGEGADGANDAFKLGGLGGGAGGNTLVAGGIGGAGGAAVAGGAGLPGSAGSSPVANSGGGGGGGGSGGTGVSGGVGADGAAGVTGYIIFNYHGPQAVLA